MLDFQLCMKVGNLSIIIYCIIMKKKNYFQFILLLTLIVIITSCAKDTKSVNKNTNRVYFTIAPNDPKILLPVQLDDSITANLWFDTGWSFNLDSSFCAMYPQLSLYATNDTLNWTRVKRAWSSVSFPCLLYENAKQSAKIGDVKLTYNNVWVQNLKMLANNDKFDGIFFIPPDDTTHIWELNFEDNYLEVHSAIDFQIPKNCFLFPIIENNYNRIKIAFPMQIVFADGDTLSMNRSFLIDTGMSADIVLTGGTQERELFNKKEGAILSQFERNFIRHHIVNATLFDNYEADSLRIFTFDRVFPHAIEYLVGLNFLKRFNVFFDMKNNKVGLLPINNFQRIPGLAYMRFHYLTRQTAEGKYIVTRVADYATNYFKTAGLKEGDEIIAVNGLPYAKYTKQNQLNRDTLFNELQNKKVILEDGRIFKGDTLIFDVIRQKKLMKVIVQIDKNEVQGD